MEKQHKEAQPKQMEALLRFAARAYRRPLTSTERDDLLTYYQTIRTKDELSHEDAVRELLVSVLMSPDFLYRIDLQSLSKPSETPALQAVAMKSSSAIATKALSSFALASRLSYFLWASMPDDELLAHAAAGDLQRKDVLLAETRRMLKDARVSGLATEFTGNWLGFRHFEQNNSVDRERFPMFNNDLREAMFQEPVRLVADALVRDRSLLDLLYANDTFVNPVLANFYGMPDVAGEADHWVEVNEANQYGRGGLLPMAVFLTQNSPGLRTSPVKRGYWVVQKLLGEVIPPPPPVVPELPHDEAKMELPVRDMLAKHRQVTMCAACHSRFDSFGLAFEGYGPVGNARTKDLADRPVDTFVSYPSGATGDGVQGLRTYIREHKQQEFVANFSRKLLAYALSRTLEPSDEPVLDRMQVQGAANGYKFSKLVETIVTSQQFLNKRVSEAPAPESGPQPRKAKT
jgi:hypothetical protein